MTIALGSAFGDFKAYFEYTTSSTNTTYSVKVTNAGMYQSCSWSEYPWKTTMTATGHDSRSGTDPTTYFTKGYHSILEENKTYSWTRKTSAYTVTIKATTKKNISGGSSGSVSKSFTVPALTKYTITYNANGGTGAPGTTTKYYGINVALSGTKPTRTGYTFLGWSTSSAATSATWSAGGTYSTNASDTLYAVWKANTYTVTFNANGGTNGSVTSKTKTYNAAMALPTAAQSPTRTYYKFLGWSTSKTATTATWAAGASYTTNITANTTLYAVWKEDYVPAKLSKPTAKRVNSSGADDDEGTYGIVTFTWTAGTMTGAAVTPSSIIVQCKETGTADTNYKTVYTVTDFTSTFVTTTAFQYNDADLSLEKQYDIKVTLTDQYNTANPVIASTFISKAEFVIDIDEEGKGVGIGTASSGNGLEVGWKTILSNGKFLFSKDTNGAESMMIGMNENNNILVGWNIYDQELGNTVLYGKQVRVNAKNGVYINDKALWETIYPVGAVYISYTSTSPAELFGGSWTAITGVFPYFNAGTATGGSNTHTITVNQMPAHNHPGSKLRLTSGKVASGSTYSRVNEQGTGTSYLVDVASQGNGQSYDRRPAYQTLYAWRRTA